MKKKSIISLCMGALVLSAATSCSDMLEPDLSGRAKTSLFGTDTVYSYLGIMKSMQNIVERQVILGDARGDLLTTSDYVTDSINDIANFNNPENGANGLLSRGDYYKVINECNLYLHNVDTAKSKNNVKYMKKEYAQVVAMRAWTYMQLVQNYGSVPFITEPVTNSNTGWEKNPPGGFATVDNLLEKLEGKNRELTEAVRISKQQGWPSYGTYQTGAIDVPSTTCMFPPEVVLADLYLLRGASVSDYAEAARYYYDYLNETSATAKTNTLASDAALFGIMSSGAGADGEDNFEAIPQAGSWINAFTSYNKSGGEVVTIIPSAANTSLGTVLKSVQNIFGFNTASTQSTSTSTDDEGNESYTTTGSISVEADLTKRQLYPSNAFTALTSSQTYMTLDHEYTSGDEGDEKFRYYNFGDARAFWSAPLTNTYMDNKRQRSNFVGKFCPPTVTGATAIGTQSYAFHYAIPVYRTAMIFLRYAEAINRAGFPEYAFAVLRDGFNSDRLPKLADSVVVDSSAVPMTTKTVYYVDTVAAEKQMYVTVDELRRAQGTYYLNFETGWAQEGGIHLRGAGHLGDEDTMYIYPKMVAQKIADEQSRVQGLSPAQTQMLANRMRQAVEEEQDTLVDITESPAKAKAIEINAVEDLIVDEMALEGAFEGYRYYDLMRIARHKNNNDMLLNGYDTTGAPTWGSDYGNKWMAWKIARRNLELTRPYDDPTNVGDASLYNRLLNQDNWYLANPVY